MHGVVMIQEVTVVTVSVYVTTGFVVSTFRSKYHGAPYTQRSLTQCDCFDIFYLYLTTLLPMSPENAQLQIH